MGVKQYTFDNGKYVIKRCGNGTTMMAYRHGEFWQNMVGDKLTASMLDEVDNLQKKIVDLEKRVSDYGWAVTEARNNYQPDNCGWK